MTRTKNLEVVRLQNTSWAWVPPFSFQAEKRKGSAGGGGGEDGRGWGELVSGAGNSVGEGRRPARSLGMPGSPGQSPGVDRAGVGDPILCAGELGGRELLVLETGMGRPLGDRDAGAVATAEIRAWGVSLKTPLVFLAPG